MRSGYHVGMVKFFPHGPMWECVLLLLCDLYFVTYRSLATAQCAQLSPLFLQFTATDALDTLIKPPVNFFVEIDNILNIYVIHIVESGSREIYMYIA